MRILLVEDEKPLSDAIVKLLKKEGFAVDPVYNGIDGLDYARAGNYDAIVLDVMLPGIDGFTVLEKMRAEKNVTPVLMLTARGGLEDRVRGLESGADYYLPKPFQISELVACLRAITRRGDGRAEVRLAFGDISLNESELALVCKTTGRSVKLGAKEYQLMELLLRNPGRVLPKETILERIWGFENDAEYNNLAVYLSFVRKKLAFVGSTVEIHASRGVGYALEEKK